MAKLLLLSILVSMIWIPVRSARIRNPAVGLRRALTGFLLFSAAYWIAVVFLYFTLFVGRDPAELLSKTVHD